MDANDSRRDMNALTDGELFAIACSPNMGEQSEQAKIVLEHRKYLEAKKLNSRMFAMTVVLALSTLAQAVIAYIKR